MRHRPLRRGLLLLVLATSALNLLTWRAPAPAVSLETVRPLMQAGRTAEAEALLSAGAEARPQDPALTPALAAVRILRASAAPAADRDEAWTKVAGDLAGWLESHPESFYGHYVQGVLAMRRGDEDTAWHALQTARRLADAPDVARPDPTYALPQANFAIDTLMFLSILGQNRDVPVEGLIREAQDRVERLADGPDSPLGFRNLAANEAFCARIREPGSTAVMLAGLGAVDPTGRWEIDEFVAIARQVTEARHEEADRSLTAYEERMGRPDGTFLPYLVWQPFALSGARTIHGDVAWKRGERALAAELWRQAGEDAPFQREIVASRLASGVALLGLR